MWMMNRVGRLSVIVGIGLLTMPVFAAVAASEKPVTGDRIVRETQEAVRATKDYTIQQKDAFQRKIQTELDEMQVHITQLRTQVKHESGKTRADVQKAIEELEKKSDLANKKLQDFIPQRPLPGSSEVETAAAMDDLRDSLQRRISPSITVYQ
jgi:Skp family chaperone for outer membrane proteins